MLIIRLLVSFRRIRILIPLFMLPLSPSLLIASNTITVGIGQEEEERRENHGPVCLVLGSPPAQAFSGASIIELKTEESNEEKKGEGNQKSCHKHKETRNLRRLEWAAASCFPVSDVVSYLHKKLRTLWEPGSQKYNHLSKIPNEIIIHIAYYLTPMEVIRFKASNCQYYNLFEERFWLEYAKAHGYLIIKGIEIQKSVCAYYCYRAALKALEPRWYDCLCPNNKKYQFMKWAAKMGHPEAKETYKKWKSLREETSSNLIYPLPP